MTIAQKRGGVTPITDLFLALALARRRSKADAKSPRGRKPKQLGASVLAGPPLNLREQQRALKRAHGAALQAAAQWARRDLHFIRDLSRLAPPRQAKADK